MSTPTVYAVRIEWDEDGCSIMLATEDGRQNLRVDDPEQLYDAVMGGIWPWLYEREQALKQYRAQPSVFACDNPEEAFIEMLRDSADLQRKAAKENGR